MKRPVKLVLSEVKKRTISLTLAAHKGNESASISATTMANAKRISFHI